jgi:hypothetical protein
MQTGGDNRSNGAKCTGAKLDAEDVQACLTDLFLARGTSEYIRSDNGYIESFNGKLRDELLNVEIFDSLFEAKVLIEEWRHEYNTKRPHSSLGYRPPAPETKEPLLNFLGTVEVIL